ncbi:MAG: tRNA epoxyqueuosine(34) reductase QueG [Candidatus Thiodiazotropha sp.]
MASGTSMTPDELRDLSLRIKQWGYDLGLDAIGITDTDLGKAEVDLNRWLARDYHGEMDYMARHGSKRSRPAELLPGTQRVICARLDYLPEPMHDALQVLDDPLQAFISRYTLGRDYHKVLRNRLQKLVEQIREVVPGVTCRVFTDSAPVLEKPLAHKAGLGWPGKHTNLIAREAGSWFFLGEIYIDLPLACDSSASDHCGRCQACIDICPTRAIVAPYQLDARLCISYLTIELQGAIPQPLRPLIGNRIYGCDDCQLICPWNRFARPTRETDFLPRHGLDHVQLIELFSWDEATFLHRTEGSAIRRLGHLRWLRNLAVALGNCATSAQIRSALERRRHHPSELVREHVIWAMDRHSKDLK